MEGSAEPMAMDQPPKSMNVMVAIDESDDSFYALQWVLDKILKPTISETQTQIASLGEQDQESKVLTIVSVVEPLPTYVFPGHVTFAESASKSQHQHAAKVLSKGYQMCKDKMLNAKTLVLEGDPKDMICRSADEMKIDLLVVGSRGLGQIKRAFLGSVSDYCVHHAKCPVLVVKPPAKKTS